MNHICTVMMHSVGTNVNQGTSAVEGKRVRLLEVLIKILFFFANGEGPGGEVSEFARTSYRGRKPRRRRASPVSSSLLLISFDPKGAKQITAVEHRRAVSGQGLTSMSAKGMPESASIGSRGRPVRALSSAWPGPGR